MKVTDFAATLEHWAQSEADAVAMLASALDYGALLLAVDRLLSGNNVAVVGVGKSGLMAQRLASQLRAVGCPACFMHPTEALHGDLGGVEAVPVTVLMFSRGGETEELRTLMMAWRAPDILITAYGDTVLARATTARGGIVLLHGDSSEIGPHGLLPTVSLTAAGIVGNLLAAGVMRVAETTSEEFAARHPAGTLGRRTTWRVSDVLSTDYGRIVPKAPLVKCAEQLAAHRGLVLVLDHDAPPQRQVLHGIVTAGDLARALAQESPEYRCVMDIMTTHPTTFSHDTLADAVLGHMEQWGIMAAPVYADNGNLLGVVHLHDILRLGIR